MNWLLICILAVIILCILYGYSKGFLRILFSLASIVLLLIFVTAATPYISKYIEEHTTLQATVEEKCLEHFQASLDKNLEEKLTEQGVDQQKMLEQAGIQLPGGVWEKLMDSGLGAANQALDVSGVYENLSKSMAQLIVKGIASLAAFLIGSIILFVIARLLNLVAKLPVIKEVNHILGILAGLIMGMVLVWVFLYFVTVFCTSPFGIMMLEDIKHSSLLTWLYENNPILYIMTLYF